jgi:16S rRNA (cytidine1402-2'-O)-methyltransferase
MTTRATKALATCDVVCCEDTRVTGKLLSALDIHKSLERLDEATIAQKADAVLDQVDAGSVVCYCSDAGMPGVSDPGQRLIARAYERGIAVEVLPGPSAVTTAYVASGFCAQSFYFGSFFPRKAGERRAVLQTLSSLDAVLIFYESPQRIISALEVVAEVLPLRKVAVCRELTKIHEEVLRGSAQQVAQILTKRTETAPIKGEIALVIDAANSEEESLSHNENLEKAKAAAAELLADSGYSKKDIVAHLRKDFGLSRNEAYEIVHGA